MNFYTALEQAEKIEFEEVYKRLTLFISECVIKGKRQRWKEKAKTPQQLYVKFNDLWNSLKTDTCHRSSTLCLKNQDYIYYCMDEHGYLLSKNVAETICRSRDGFLFSTNFKEVVFLTHESEYYTFQLANGG